MREVEQVTYYRVDMQWLAKITQEIYGREYDIQMGERNNGEYDIVDTDPNAIWNDWPGEYADDSGEWHYLKTATEAIEHWMNSPKPERSYDRPEWQPSVWAVLSDLADKGEIPHGEYFISIDW